MSVFKIFIDRLRGGHTHKIDECVIPHFLGPDEPELCFKTPVSIQGEAYLTDAHLILHLQASTKVAMPCAVCNELIDVPVSVNNFYHTEPVDEIPSAIFDYSEALREALLLELPKTVECKGGQCPERTSLMPYMRSQDRTGFPFADMDKKLK